MGSTMPLGLHFNVHRAAAPTTDTPLTTYISKVLSTETFALTSPHVCWQPSALHNAIKPSFLRLGAYPNTSSLHLWARSCFHSSKLSLFPFCPSQGLSVSSIQAITTKWNSMSCNCVHCHVSDHARYSGCHQVPCVCACHRFSCQCWGWVRCASKYGITCNHTYSQISRVCSTLYNEFK